MKRKRAATNLIKKISSRVSPAVEEMHTIPLPREVKARSRHTLMSVAVEIATASYLGVAAGDVEPVLEMDGRAGSGAVSDDPLHSLVEKQALPVEPVEEEKGGLVDAPGIHEWTGAVVGVKIDGWALAEAGWESDAAVELSMMGLDDQTTVGADEERSLETQQEVLEGAGPGAVEMAKHGNSVAMVRGSKEAAEVANGTEEGGGFSWMATTGTPVVAE